MNLGLKGLKKTLHGSQIHMPRGKLYHLLTALLFTKNVHENNASIKEDTQCLFFRSPKNKQTQVFQQACTHTFKILLVSNKYVHMRLHS